MSPRRERPASFGSWLRIVRQTLRLTRRQLARLSYCSESTIRTVESGRCILGAEATARIVKAIATQDQSLADQAPAIRELGEVVIRSRGDRLWLQVELDLAAVRRLSTPEASPASGPRGLRVALSVVEKKSGW